MASFDEASNPLIPAAAPLFTRQMFISNNGHHHQQFQQHQNEQPSPTLTAPTLVSNPTLALSPLKFPMGVANGLTFSSQWGDINNTTSAAGGQFVSNATVVSNSSSSAANKNTTVGPDPLHLQSRVATTSILLPPSQHPRSTGGDAVTHPVPEFLCHLFSIVTDPALSDLISWSVPTNNERDNCGGGMQNIGKIVVHDPQGLQDYVLGKYYRHSKYSSFQRQLNYFGFKKKLHGGKKGKLCPCSYVHEGLGAEPTSLFTLKRRLRAGGGARSSKNNQVKNSSNDDDDEEEEEDGSKKVPINTASSSKWGDGNKRRSMASSTAASVSSTSSSLNNSRRGDSDSFTKLGGLSSPPSNKAMIVKDSNHANFHATLPYPPPSQLTNDVTSSSVLTAPVSLTMLPNNSTWIQLTGNSAMMPMPFQPHLQAGIHDYHQQLLNNSAAAANAAAGGNIQVSTAPSNANKGGPNISSKDFNTEITIARANEVAREAQKALERAYRKRKQEAADEDDVMAAATASAQQYQQHQHIKQQQQQQPQQMLLPGFQKMIQQPAYTMMQNQQLIPANSIDFNAGNDNQAVCNFPPGCSMDASGQTIDFASLGKQIWAQFNPQLIQGLNAQMGGFPQGPPPATAVAPPSTFPTTNSTATTMGAPYRTSGAPSNQPRYSNGSSSPIMFDDLFSKLLSTTLPPPEELFDDDSSTGQLSDFGAELQALG